MTRPSLQHCKPESLLDTVDGDREIFLTLCQIFFRESRKKLGEMREAATKGKFRELGELSHSLKGTAGPLDAGALVALLQSLEDDCQYRPKTVQNARIEAIQHELNHVAIELKTYIGRL
jgi:HPt (histidine-containing phosphotransfer) domain-containing protein